MELVEDFGAKAYTYSLMNEYINIFAIEVKITLRDQDHSLTSNKCHSYFDRFKLSGLFR